MKNYSALALLLSCLLLGANISCKKDLYVTELPDLTCEGLLFPDDIIVGEPFEVEVLISNNMSDFGATTLDANESELNVLFQMRDTSGNWVKISELVTPVAEIKAGTKKSVKLQMVINTPGEYRFDFFADATNLVEERNELNNTDETEF